MAKYYEKFSYENKSDKLVQIYDSKDSSTFLFSISPHSTVSSTCKNSLRLGKITYNNIDICTCDMKSYFAFSPAQFD